MMHRFTRKPQPQRVLPRKAGVIEAPPTTESFSLFTDLQGGGSALTGSIPRFVNVPGAPELLLSNGAIPPTAEQTAKPQTVKLAPLFRKKSAIDSLFGLPKEAMSIAPPVSPHTAASVSKEPRRHSAPVSQRRQKNKENYIAKGLADDLAGEGANVLPDSVMPIADDALSSVYKGYTNVIFHGLENNLKLNPQYGPAIQRQIEEALHGEPNQELRSEIREDIEKEIQPEIYNELQEILAEKSVEEPPVTVTNIRALSLPQEEQKSKKINSNSVSTQTDSPPLVLPSINSFPVQATTEPPHFELKEPQGSLKEILALKSKYLVPWSLLELITIEDRWEFIQTIEKGVRDITLRYGLPDDDKTVMSIYMTLTDDYTRDSLDSLDPSTPTKMSIAMSQSLAELRQALESHSLDMINTLTEFKLMILLKGIPPLMIHTWTKQLLRTISSYPHIETHGEFMSLVCWISEHTVILQFIPTKTIHDLLVFSGCLNSLKSVHTFTKEAWLDNSVGRWLTFLQKLAMVQPSTFFSKPKIGTQEKLTR